MAAEQGCTRCGHPKDAHKHLRRGTNCGLCDCPKYQRRWLFFNR